MLLWNICITTSTQIIYATRMAPKIATNYPNVMIFASIERGESVLENDGRIVNFGSNDGKLQ